MMAVVILGGFINLWWISLLGLPIFLFSILGAKFSFKPKKVQVRKSIKSYTMSSHIESTL